MLFKLVEFEVFSDSHLQSLLRCINFKIKISTFFPLHSFTEPSTTDDKGNLIQPEIICSENFPICKHTQRRVMKLANSDVIFCPYIQNHENLK
jgi:hypothetical protein